MKIGIMIDANNLFFTLRMKFSRKLDYAKYLEFCEELGDINFACVYGVHVKGQAIDFLTKLKAIGYIPCYTNVKERDKTKIRATVRMVVDAMSNTINYDTLIVGSSDKNMIPLFEYLAQQQKKVVVISTNIPNSMKLAAHKCIEIPKSMLE